MYIIIYLFIIAFGALCLYFFYRKRKKEKAEEENMYKGETANDFMNTKNIRRQVLFTKDDKRCSYIEIEPVNIDLLSDKDMASITESLTAELSELRYPFKYYALSKPEDNRSIMAQYSKIIQSTDDPVIRNILRNEIQQRQTQVQNAEMPTRKYYFHLWADRETDEEFKKRVESLREKLDNCGIKAKIISPTEIVEFIEMVANPQYAVPEDLKPEINFSFLIKQYGGDV